MLTERFMSAAKGNKSNNITRTSIFHYNKWDQR